MQAVVVVQVRVLARPLIHDPRQLVTHPGQGQSGGVGRVAIGTEKHCVVDDFGSDGPRSVLMDGAQDRRLDRGGTGAEGQPYLFG